MRLAVAVSVTFALWAARVHAGCTTGTLDVFPDVRTAIPRTPHLVLSGTGVYGPEIQALATRAPRLVRQDGEEVPLTVRIIERGDATRVSAVLVPETPLSLGSHYVMRLDAVAPRADGTPSPLPEAPTVYRFLERNGPTGGQVAVSWRVDEGPDTPPRWRGRPTMRKEVVGTFCPYPRYVEVDVPVENSARVLAYELAVTRAGGTTVLARSLERPEDGAIAIGALGCEANAVLAPGVRYRVRVTAVGLDGVRVPAPGTVVVIGPRPRDR
jgi:hypothetical protein